MPYVPRPAEDIDLSISPWVNSKEAPIGPQLRQEPPRSPSSMLHYPKQRHGAYRVPALGRADWATKGPSNLPPPPHDDDIIALSVSRRLPPAPDVSSAKPLAVAEPVMTLEIAVTPKSTAILTPAPAATRKATAMAEELKQNSEIQMMSPLERLINEVEAFLTKTLMLYQPAAMDRLLGKAKSIEECQFILSLKYKSLNSV